jgi:hypothetical protein
MKPIMKDPQKPISKSSPHTEDLIDHYWGTIEYISSLIKASEIKAGLILSFYGILLNLIYQSFNSIYTLSTSVIIFYIVGGAWVLVTVISVYFSIRCFMPRIETKYEKNVFFFGDVISAFGDEKQFAKTFYEISIDEDRVFDQLGQQVYILSSIAAAKFKNVNRSLQFLGIGLALIMLFLILSAISTINS